MAAPWSAAHVCARDTGALQEPLTWLLQQALVTEHLWHAWPLSAELLLGYQQASAAVVFSCADVVVSWHGLGYQQARRTPCLCDTK